VNQVPTSQPLRSYDEDEPGCIQEGPECAGAVLYRDPLSATGKSFQRCDHHWLLRLELERGLRERYPEHPPADWSPMDAGEHWDEDDAY
jgi:hypothetical protein